MNKKNHFQSSGFYGTSIQIEVESIETTHQ